MGSIRWAAGVLALLGVSAGPVLSVPPVKTNKPVPGKPEAKEPAAGFTVASYNINYGNPNLREVVRAIVTADADLLCLQHVTWHWQAGRVRWQYRLDYIFHSRHIRTLSSAVVRTGGSDHYLLTSRLAWAPDKATTRPAPPGR